MLTTYMSCRSCKRLAIVAFLLLSIFGLLLNVTNDQPKLIGVPVKKVDNTPTTIFLNSTSYKKYCVVYDFWKSTKPVQPENSITLLIHSTLKYLHFLEKHADWTGPISISIFMPRPETVARSILSPSQHLNTLFSMLADMKQKLRNRDAISVHLFFENESRQKCKEVKYEFQPILWNQTTIQKMPNFFSVYPINVARNVARHRLRTRLFLSGDIEQLFSSGYEEKVGKLAQELQLTKKKKKLLLIHRRFECSEDSVVPKTKKQLKNLYDKGKAVEFHKNYYANAHIIPDLKEWFEVEESKNSTSIFMILNYTNAEYEPQFVGDQKTVPFHDESFPFRQRSNTHLAAELCRASFRFAILNDVFSVHEGIKTTESAIEVAAKKLAIRDGYLQTVEHFKQKLDRKYPKTKNQCPEFLA